MPYRYAGILIFAFSNDSIRDYAIRSLNLMSFVRHPSYCKILGYESYDNVCDLISIAMPIAPIYALEKLHRIHY
jgi:hypothetical protein